MKGAWEPYVPFPSQVELEEVEGEPLLKASIVLPSAGFTVNWGEVQRADFTLWMDVKPYHWTGQRRWC